MCPSKREVFKDVELNGYKFRIGRFDALLGSYIAFTLLTKMLPSGIEQQVMGDQSLPKGRTSMSKEEFIELQKDCLKICHLLKDVGGKEVPVPILTSYGEWATDGLNEDVMTVLVLTIHVLIFNIVPFFEGDALKNLLGSFQGLSLFNAPTSTSSPSDQS